MTNPKKPFLDVARFALTKHYPGFRCAFVAGSMLRGQETEKSDIDIVVLFDKNFDAVHRNSVIEEGWPVEFFVQNEQAQDYFLDRDRQRGACAMASMIAEGIVLPGRDPYSDSRKGKARKIIEAGPPALTSDRMAELLYHITDALDDLDPDRPIIEMQGIYSDLYTMLGDFYLRAHGRWSGEGKALGRLLKQNFPALSEKFQTAFRLAYAGDHRPVEKLTIDVLNEFGGRHWAGHYSKASEDWKNFNTKDLKL